MPFQLIHLRKGLGFLIHQKYETQSTFGKQLFVYDQIEQKDIIPNEPFIEIRV